MELNIFMLIMGTMGAPNIENFLMIVPALFTQTTIHGTLLRETTEIPIHLKTHLWKSILKSIMTHISVPGLFQTDMVHDLICPHTTGLGTMATGIEVPTIGKGRHMPGRDRHISLRSLHMLVKGLHMTAAITMIVEEVQVTLNGPVIAGMELLNIWKIPRAIVPDVMAIEI